VGGNGDLQGDGILMQLPRIFRRGPFHYIVRYEHDNGHFRTFRLVAASEADARLLAARRHVEQFEPHEQEGYQFASCVRV
jgi:hypothetical protein